MISRKKAAGIRKIRGVKDEKKSDIWVSIAIAAAAIIAILALIALRIKLGQLETEKQAIESQMSSYEDRIAELEDALSLSDSEFLEKYDKDKTK
ncbi:MAG: hypothetical protein KBS59_02495 [Clostridiales bacterium]|nr:hypothetical protein [Clostridiales bacterium]